MPEIVALARCETYSFSKERTPSLQLLKGLGVEGDIHCGKTVKHRSRVAKDPHQPNLRQVHLLQSELLDEVRQAGFEVEAGQIGENISTRGIDLLGLPTGSRLSFGPSALIEITGLRNPCRQIEDFQNGLLAAVVDRDDSGELIRRAGVMAIVIESGKIKVGDAIALELPPEPHHPLVCV